MGSVTKKTSNFKIFPSMNNKSKAISKLFCSLTIRKKQFQNIYFHEQQAISYFKLFLAINNKKTSNFNIYLFMDNKNEAISSHFMALTAKTRQFQAISCH